MKRLRSFLILVYIITTLLVLIIHPVMHKPVALETPKFKLKNQILNPQQRFVSDFEVKIKFYRRNHQVVKSPEKEFIPKEGDDKQLSMNFEKEDNFQNRTIEFNEEINVSEQTQEIDTSANNGIYSEKNIDYQSQSVENRDVNVKISSDDVQSRRDVNVEIDSADIPNSDVELRDKDEVGNILFSASREEFVAWNVWRSNLQNKIMMESSIEAPVGTLIVFTFNVSKNGKITNLKYSCSNKKYEADARADMVSILRRLENTSVLAFPSNTKRTNVKFKGAFMLDYSTSFSKPSDYSDYERVRY